MSKTATNRKIHDETNIPKDVVGPAKKTAAKKIKRDNTRQFSVHLRESIHRDTKIALLMQGGKQDFSGLVEQLLTEYLSKQKFQYPGT